MSLMVDFFGSGISYLGYLKKYKIKKGDVVIDAGAYLGYFTLRVAKIVGKSGKVIAFEPSAANFVILKENVKKSGLNNVVLINKAIYNRETRLFFPRSVGSGAMSKECETKGNEIGVKAVLLDSEMARLGIKKVDFLKMDIEGAEIEAIEGGKTTLKNSRNLAIACYHRRNGVTTDKLMFPVLKKLGFELEKGYFLHPTLFGWRRGRRSAWEGQAGWLRDV